MLQTTVRRALTSGFAGDLMEDGPRRARPARIASPSVAGVSTNRMGRAFGYYGEVPLPAAAQGAAYEAQVVLGGAVFFGILGNPYSYVNYGSSTDALGTSQDLPFGALGEFFDMATALCVEIFNEKNTAITNHFGDRIAYTSVLSPAGVPIGGLVALPPDGSAAPAGYIVIPNARLVRTFDMAASPPAVPVSMLSVIQLTQ